MKKKINIMTSIPVEKMRLVFNNQVLSNELKMQAYDIEKGEELLLQTAPRKLIIVIPNRRVVSLIAQNNETVEDICRRACMKAQTDPANLHLCNDKKKLDENKLMGEYSKDDLRYLTVENGDAIESMK